MANQHSCEVCGDPSVVVIESHGERGERRVVSFCLDDFERALSDARARVKRLELARDASMQTQTR
jgi:hypothetical protein